MCLFLQQFLLSYKLGWLQKLYTTHFIRRIIQRIQNREQEKEPAAREYMDIDTEESTILGTIVETDTFLSEDEEEEDDGRDPYMFCQVIIIIPKNIFSSQKTFL